MRDDPQAADAARAVPADRVLAELAEALGPGGVHVGERLALHRTHDWSAAPAAVPAALVLPRTPAEVARVLAICHRHRTALVVQGGLTGLAGGANPRHGEIALSLARLASIEEVDDIAGVAVVQAGVTLQALQEAVEARGWMFPLDLAARGSCQLGGNAAANAGGNRVLRYGTMRRLVLGLEVALPDGRVLTMLDRVAKNNAGFDLKQLFIGSEGTLGVITRLSLALSPLPGHRTTALCALGDLRAAAALLKEARRRLPDMSSFEVMWAGFVEASAQAQGRPLPFGESHPLYVLLETMGGDPGAADAALEAVLGDALATGRVRDAVVAQSVAQAERLWSLREGISEILALVKPCAAFDVSVPLAHMDALVDRVRTRLEAAFPGRRHLFFGHLGDGNLHLASGPYPDHDAMARAEAIVYGCVGEAGGSISGEHGIGILKKPFLHHSRSADEIDVMRRLKAVLDPRGILNPGRVF